MRYYIFGEANVGVCYSGEIPSGAIECSYDVYCNSMGYKIKNGELIAPTEEEVEEIKRRDKANLNNTILSEKLRVAGDVIAPLQDAVDYEIATDEEKKKLKEWKMYRISLSRLNIDSGDDIVFPNEPQTVDN